MKGKNSHGLSESPYYSYKKFAAIQEDGTNVFTFGYYLPRKNQKSVNDPDIGFCWGQLMSNQFYRQTSITINDSVFLGGYDWTVLDIESGKALLITKDIVGKQAYNASNEITTWEQCSLRSYLNGLFYYQFSDDEKKLIQDTVIVTSNNPQYGTNGGNPTVDKIFLLSIDEANQYFPTDSQRVAAYQGTARWWWLRSPGISNHATFVYSDGFVNAHGYRVDYAYTGVRPAMYLSIV